MPKMKIAHEGSRPSAPLSRQIGQSHRDAHHARPCRVHERIKASDHGEREYHIGDPRPLPAEAANSAYAINDPAGNRRKQEKTCKSQPDGREKMPETNHWIKGVPTHERSCDKSHGKHCERQLGGPGRSRATPEMRHCGVH